ncbi:MAG: hypothetical protein ACRDNZ_11440, partial [Streptosporangiaceae bacterium]
MTAVFQPADPPASTPAKTQQPGARPASRGRRLRRSGLGWLVAGEAGAGIAWILGVAALLTAFLATAAPRELTADSTSALQHTLASLVPAAKSLTVTAQWQPLSEGGTSVIDAAQIAAFPSQIAALLAPPLSSPPGQRWGSFATPTAGVTNPAPSAIAKFPPAMEVSYRTDLASYAHLVAGTLPGGVTGANTVQVVATEAVAAQFSLRPGSVIDLTTGLRLEVSGIVVPIRPGQAYWTVDPLPSQPEVQHGSWTAGVIVGPDGITKLQEDQAGQYVQGTWFLPLNTARMTEATLPVVLSRITQLATSDHLPAFAQSPSGLRLGFSQAASIQSAFAGSLSVFLGEQQATSAIGDLIITGLLVAALVLLLVCARLAADAYRPELALLRARGGNSAQAAVRVLTRASLIAVPGA